MNPIDLSVYLVTDRGICERAGHTVVSASLAAAAGGATVIQVRDKSSAAAAFLADVMGTAQKLPPETMLLVNDRVDVYLAAKAFGARVDGVHIGQDDLPAAVVRQLIGPDAIMGVSAVSDAELAAAVEDGADYVGIGIVRNTATKTDAPDALGVAGIGAVARRTDLPTVAIGGIKLGDAAGLKAASVDGMAIVSAICGVPDPEQATRSFVRAWRGSGGSDEENS